MKIGVFATFMSPIANTQMIMDFGRRAEEIGLDSVWLGEHVVLFNQMEFPYPGSADGKIPVPEGGGLLETVATFGVLAAATTKLRLGTGIALVPQRNPIYTAKEFATLDYLTNGRMDLGIGVGWCKEEVIACGYDWSTRGRRCSRCRASFSLPYPRAPVPSSASPPPIWPWPQAEPWDDRLLAGKVKNAMEEGQQPDVVQLLEGYSALLEALALERLLSPLVEKWWKASLA